MNKNNVITGWKVSKLDVFQTNMKAAAFVKWLKTYEEVQFNNALEKEKFIYTIEDVVAQLDDDMPTDTHIGISEYRWEEGNTEMSFEIYENGDVDHVTVKFSITKLVSPLNPSEYDSKI